MQKLHDQDSVEAVRQELLAEALARAEYNPERAEKIRAAMRAAQERVAMPRVAVEPTEIRRWAVERSARFGPVGPAQQVERWMRAETMSIALGGATPTPEQVSQLAALVSEDARVDEMLASIALLTLPLASDASDVVALQELVRGALRPVDLETLVNAALLLEFAAAHVIGTKRMARLLTAASLLWWTAGQRTASIRALRLPLHYEAEWPLTQRMRTVLRLRSAPSWYDA